MMEDRRPALGGCKPSAVLLLWVNHPVGAISVLHHDFDFDTDVVVVSNDYTIPTIPGPGIMGGKAGSEIW